MLAQEKQVYKWLLIRWISFINQGHTNIFKVNLLQWYLFTKPYRFPVYNSIKHLHTALCAITPSKVFLSLFSTPLPTSNIHTPCSSAPFPLAIPTLICVYTKNLYGYFLHLLSSSSPNLSTFWQLSASWLYPWVCFYFVPQFHSLDSTYEWDHMVFVFLWLLYFT